jgi:hypothetical protein
VTVTLAFITLAVLVVGWRHTSSAGAGDRDWQATAAYRGQLAAKYRRQRDNLQRRLTRRVLQTRELQRQIQRYRRQTVHRPDALEAIRLASIAYHVDYRQMRALASCETGGSFNPYSKNPASTASGLFQFLTGTFAGTPYGRESIWSPYASALAAGWMMAHGRRSEWSC